MNENQISYYAVIPATVRYDKELKAQEKLLYGEITALANRYGYCYAKNKYLAELYDVSIETISRWISKLEKQGYIKTEIIRNENKMIVERRIYIIDNPCKKESNGGIDENDNTYSQNYQYPYPQKDQYQDIAENSQNDNTSSQKNQYPYSQKCQEGIVKNVKENNIKINKIDGLFNLIIKQSDEIPENFYNILEKFEMNYTSDIFKYIASDKIEIIKNIIYVLYELYTENYGSLLMGISRESLISLYFETVKRRPNNLLNYYKRLIINKNASVIKYD